MHPAVLSACETSDVCAANGRFGFPPISQYWIIASENLLCTAASQPAIWSSSHGACRCNSIGPLCPHTGPLLAVDQASAIGGKVAGALAHSRCYSADRLDDRMDRL